MSSSDATYHVEFTLQPVVSGSSLETAQSGTGGTLGHTIRRTKARKVAGRRQETAEKTIAVDIAQDLASLRNRKGDTGRLLSMFLNHTRL